MGATTRGNRVGYWEVKKPTLSHRTREGRGTRIVFAPEKRLCFAVDLGPPPADADEQESPVAEELRGLAFEGVADELEDPSHEEQAEAVGPEAMQEEARGKYRDRDQNQRNAQGVADAVHRMLVTAGILRDPLLAAAVA